MGNKLEGKLHKSIYFTQNFLYKVKISNLDSPSVWFPAQFKSLSLSNFRAKESKSNFQFSLKSHFQTNKKNLVKVCLHFDRIKFATSFSRNFSCQIFCLVLKICSIHDSVNFRIVCRCPWTLKKNSVNQRFSRPHFQAYKHVNRLKLYANVTRSPKVRIVP